MKKQTKELLEGLNLHQKEKLLAKIIEYYGLHLESFLYGEITRIRNHKKKE